MKSARKIAGALFVSILMTCLLHMTDDQVYRPLHETHIMPPVVHPSKTVYGPFQSTAHTSEVTYFR